MGIFDFIFGKNTQPAEEEKPKIEEVRLADLENWIIKQEQSMKQKDGEILEKVKIWRDESKESILKKLDNAQKLSMEKYKAEERVKTIVEDNYKRFIQQTGQLLQNIDAIPLDEPHTTITLIAKHLDEFEKSSFMSYQKATFLIGKEMGEIRESLKTSKRNMQEIVKLNQEHLHKKQALLPIRETLRHIQAADITIADSTKELNVFNEKAKKAKIELELTESKHKEFLASKDFAEHAKVKSERKENLAKWEQKIAQLKQELNIKALMKHYHSNEKYRELIKEYDSGFKAALLKDESIVLASLVEGAGKLELKKELISLYDEGKKLTQAIQPLPAEENYIKKKADLEHEIKELNLGIERIKEKLERFTNRQEQRIHELEEIGKSVSLVILRD